VLLVGTPAPVSRILQARWVAAATLLFKGELVSLKSPEASSKTTTTSTYRAFEELENILSIIEEFKYI
tara:strand:- start:125 stop:328 length:204 start_codon:yes stop_codon:yes gene_type:complete